MKVKELIEQLMEMDEEAELIIQKDSEGNGYSPLAGADHDAVYIPETTWYGTVYSTEWCAVDAGMDVDEWEKILSKPKCVVLFPVN